MLIVPAMVKASYDKSYASAVTAASGGWYYHPHLSPDYFGISAMSDGTTDGITRKFTLYLFKRCLSQGHYRIYHGVDAGGNQLLILPSEA